MKDIFEGDGIPLKQAGFTHALQEVGGDAAALWSILQVETSGFGFFDDRRPKILFERHVFHDRTGGRFDAKAPDLSNKTPGGYSSGANEYSRLKRAMLLDRTAALESVSWGLGQVMGFNAVTIGYPSAEVMISKFAASESEQILGCAKFISATPALKRAFQAHQWEKVAFFYNGKKYAERGYDKKLEAAHIKLTAPNAKLPSVELREMQAYLTYLGYNPRGIDGIAGTHTETALQAFRDAWPKPPKAPELPKPGSPPSDYLPFVEFALQQRSV